jgi:cobalamin-dependent methionine synthase I
MSGLLVKSTVVMRENLEEMSRQGVEVPVLLGGAALTRNYCRGRLRPRLRLRAASPTRATPSTGCT